MCGIWALINHNNIDKQKLKKYENLYNSIQERGPDKTNILQLNNNAYVFHRLAIHDLSPLGDQPFIFYDEGCIYILICNGEIYNYKSLISKYNFEKDLKSDSDCEVIFHLYLKYKDINKVILELRGEFVFILSKISDLDSFTYVCRDPFGVRPLFYSCDQSLQRIFLSSLLSGVIDSKSEKGKVFPPGCILTIKKLESNLDMSWYEYYNYNYPKYTIYTENIYFEITSRLINAVKIRLDSDRPIGALLSGGLDSSLICAIASKILGIKSLKTFSIGMKKGTDLEYAQLVAEHLNCDHTEVYFTTQDGLDAIDHVLDTTETWDITTIRASVGQYFLGKYISQNTNIKVILNGDGADEVEMGYLYFYLAPDKISAQTETEKLLKEIHIFDGLRVDRCISKHGLEARVPFLDIDFVDYYMSINSYLKIPINDSRMEKQLIRDAFNNLYPDLLPKSVIYRKKEAFSDGVSSKEKSWYQIISEWIETKVTDEEYYQRDQIIYLECKSKESYYYKKKFNEKFNKTLNPSWDVIPHYWLPNWIETNGEPSARILSIYK